MCVAFRDILCRVATSTTVAHKGAQGTHTLYHTRCLPYKLLGSTCLVPSRALVCLRGTLRSTCSKSEAVHWQPHIPKMMQRYLLLLAALCNTSAHAEMTVAQQDEVGLESGLDVWVGHFEEHMQQGRSRILAAYQQHVPSTPTHTSPLPRCNEFVVALRKTASSRTCFQIAVLLADNVRLLPCCMCSSKCPTHTSKPDSKPTCSCRAPVISACALACCTQGCQ